GPRPRRRRERRPLRRPPRRPRRAARGERRAVGRLAPQPAAGAGAGLRAGGDGRRRQPGNSRWRSGPSAPDIPEALSVGGAHRARWSAVIRREDWKQAAIAGGVTFAATLAMLRHGIAITSDGWAYWQGSVSLLEGRGYTFLYYDVPIQAWPPLYSLYLALWQ